MERKKLTYSQKEVIRLKKEAVQIKQAELNIAVNQIALEHGIEDRDFGNWQTTENDEYIEKKPA